MVVTRRNLFTLSPSLCLEDRFTAQFCFLIQLEPTIGQKIVDLLGELTGAPKAKFQSIVDHPTVTKDDRPDCLIRTNRYDVLLEHKLNSGLEVRQLERYLAHCGERTYLALVSTDRQQISPEIARSPRYLCPRPGMSPNHLLWRDLFPVIDRHGTSLAGQFSDYMRQLGMNPFDWDSKGDPFVDATAADSFRELYRPLRDNLASCGLRTVVRRNSLGLMIYGLGGGVRLLYVAPSKWDGLLDIPISGRLFTMTAWQEVGCKPLAKQRGFIPGQGPNVHVFTGEPSYAPWKKSLFCTRNYDVSLDELLEPGADGSARLIANVVGRVIEHLQSAS